MSEGIRPKVTVTYEAPNPFEVSPDPPEQTLLMAGFSSLNLEMGRVIRDKMGYPVLLLKYSLTPNPLNMPLQKLLDAGMLTEEELPTKPQTVFAEPLPSVTKECPRCGELMNEQDDKCPHCGVVISKNYCST
jgi:hypothetical protein